MLSFFGGLSLPPCVERSEEINLWCHSSEFVPLGFFRRVSHCLGMQSGICLCLPLGPPIISTCCHAYLFLPFSLLLSWVLGITLSPYAWKFLLAELPLCFLFILLLLFGSRIFDILFLLAQKQLHFREIAFSSQVCTVTWAYCFVMHILLPIVKFPSELIGLLRPSTF